MRYRIATQAVLIAMLYLLAAPAVAEGPKVTPLMGKDLVGLTG
jgi:hypothetical protein